MEATERRPFDKGAYRGSLAEAAVDAVYAEMMAEFKTMADEPIQTVYIETDAGVKLRPRTSLLGPWMHRFRETRRQQAKAVWPWSDEWSWNGDADFDQHRRRPYDHVLDGA